MTADDNEAFVRAHWPGAFWALDSGFGWISRGQSHPMASPPLGTGPDEPAAWADAARRIREADEVPIHERREHQRRLQEDV